MLKSHGARGIFGTPRTFVLPFFKARRGGLLALHTLSHEPAVGFAANAAARVHGGASVAVATWGAGVFNPVNPVAELASPLGSAGVRVRPRGEPAAALARAHATRGRFQLVETMLPRGRTSGTLSRFVARFKAARERRQEGDRRMMYEGVSRVAVLGTGTIGASWAAYFLARGLEVSASDPAPEAKAFLRRFVETAWPTLERLGLGPGADPSRLRFHPDPAAAVDGAQWVQENGPEREAVKVELFRRVGDALPPEAIIASSSSTLLVSRMQAGCRHPERVVLGHPFNPPHLIPLVEVVGGARTAPETVDRAVAFYAAVGKRPIRLHKEVPGHVSNRLQAAVWREAAHLVEQGVVSVADVDAAIAQGPGLRWAIMGPVLTYHLGGGAGGLRHLMDHIGVDTLWHDLGHPAMTPELEQRLIDGVEAETGGRPTPELARERDVKLVAILQGLRRAEEGQSDVATRPQ